jgi:hypothetical protein
MIHGQIWLSPLVDDCQATYLTKWGRENKKKLKLFIYLFFLSEKEGVSQRGLAILH